MDRKNYQIIQGVMLTLNAVKGKHLALKFFTEHVLSETARFFAMLRMTFILHFTFYILNCLYRAGADVLQKILRGKIFWLAPCLARI